MAIKKPVKAAKNLKTGAPVAVTAASRIDIGLSESAREKIAAGLSGLLADSYTLYLMTHNFHWNVKGPMFNTLHLMFMAQYTEQWAALDLVAERIRARVAGTRFMGVDGSMLPRLTVSIGVAMFPVRTTSPEDLVGHADAALYAAKRAGKDRVETYG